MRFSKAIILAVFALVLLLVGYFQGYLHGTAGTMSGLKGLLSDAAGVKKLSPLAIVGPLTVTVQSKPFGMHIRRGSLFVEETFPGFPAEKHGVREGCLIAQIDNKSAAAGTWLDLFMKATPPFNMTFLCPPQAQAGFGPISHDKHNYRVMVVKRPFGMNVQVHTVPRVVEVLPGSAAEKAGVKRGMVVKAVAEVDVNSQTWASAWQKAEMPFVLTFDTDVPLKKDNPFINATSGEWLPPGNQVPLEEVLDHHDMAAELEGEHFSITVNELPFGMEVDAPPGKHPRVKSVVPGLPAEHAGVRPGDVILKIAGRYVESSSWFGAFQHAVPPFGMQLYRPSTGPDSDEHTDDDIVVTVQERPFGMHVRRGSSIVEEAFPKFPAHKAGIRKGCEIKEIAGKPVAQGTWMELFQKEKLPFSMVLYCPKNTSKESHHNHGPIKSEGHDFRVKVTKRPFGMNIQNEWVSHTHVVPRVVEVLPGYPAEAVGVKAGFVLTQINKKDVNGTNWFDAWQHAPLGSVLTFHTEMPLHEDNPFHHHGLEEGYAELDLPLPDLGEGFDDFKCGVKKLPFGMQIIASKGGRPTVKNVTRGLPAESEGIRPGDILVEVAGLPVDTSSWFASFQQAVPPFGLRFLRPQLKKQEDASTDAPTNAPPTTAPLPPPAPTPAPTPPPTPTPPSTTTVDVFHKEEEVLRPGQQNATGNETGDLVRPQGQQNSRANTTGNFVQL